MVTSDRTNEKEVAAAFSRQALVFDEYDAGNTIIHYKRQRVRTHVLSLLAPGSTILELNSGTGTDAIFFAREGHRVHATDIAEGMQARLREKVRAQHLDGIISTELRSFTDLANLSDKGPYDCIFSNFAGLNCTRELDKVLHSFAPLVKPGGLVTLVILPRFSLWETAMLFRGKFKTAFRRMLSGRKGAPAHVEGVHFRCWYYSPSFVRRELSGSFQQVKLEGLCTIVPPSYIEHFAEKHPVAWNLLRARENKWRDKWPWRSIGDYYIISFRKQA
ncbi:class I SAM-dependent methyltransferase [Puia sp.]|jgi:ubiquinone/menaquinone biosynthesis C-methylase UbiE|uniref:class I SAM-dependent methyltransferase n=1 Tax=Puia sp. TaxID=2045100 RepID=UPI002F3EDC13